MDGELDDAAWIDAPVVETWWETANERFALFFPEKRPFFLEGIELFATPIQAVYTRTFTSPEWGARATATRGRTAYTVLVGQDEGGGSTILPGATGSSFWRRSGTVASSRAMRVKCGGPILPARRTGSSSTRISATIFAPTTASCRG